MTKVNKFQDAILSKLNIASLNLMQQEAIETISSSENILLLSSTGSGKTLAFLLPIIADLEISIKSVQALILVPSRELALQIEQVARTMGSGHKINAVYGGRPLSMDKKDFQSPPSLLIGTPGRVADHLRRRSFETKWCKTLVLDEFDKSLEIGFEDEMSEIIEHLDVKKKILTSATQGVKIPSFVKFTTEKIIDYLDDQSSKLKTLVVLSPKKDKLDTLVHLLKFLENKTGIVFCNFRESTERVGGYLEENNISYSCFHGGMEQLERERALAKFRNGSDQLLIATDLAARGIDIIDLDFIIHYHLPVRKEEFVHRNGRTARMHRTGAAYVLLWEKDQLPGFITADDTLIIEDLEYPSAVVKSPQWNTILISAGRRDKISKGDIVGFLIKKGQISAEQIGSIELKTNLAYVAIDSDVAQKVKTGLDNQRLKKKKVRITLL